MTNYLNVLIAFGQFVSKFMAFFRKMDALSVFGREYLSAY